MQYNKFGYIIVALYSIGLSTTIAICYGIKHNWFLSFTHLLHRPKRKMRQKRIKK